MIATIGYWLPSIADSQTCNSSCPRLVFSCCTVLFSIRCQMPLGNSLDNGFPGTRNPYRVFEGSSHYAIRDSSRHVC